MFHSNNNSRITFARYTRTFRSVIVVRVTFKNNYYFMIIIITYFVAIIIVIIRSFYFSFNRTDAGFENVFLFFSVTLSVRQVNFDVDTIFARYHLKILLHDGRSKDDCRESYYYYHYCAYAILCNKICIINPILTTGGGATQSHGRIRR